MIHRPNLLRNMHKFLSLLVANKQHIQIYIQLPLLIIYFLKNSTNNIYF